MGDAANDLSQPKRPITRQNTPACILTMRSKQGEQRLTERIHVQSRIEHGENVAIVQMAAGADDDGLTCAGIRPTRRHIATSPHGGLYAMPSLCRSA
jgi:hypothetical protein